MHPREGLPASVADPRHVLRRQIQVARDAGAQIESVEGLTQAMALLSQGRVDVVVNDSLSIYDYLATTNDTSVKIAGTTGEKSEQGFAARKNSGLLPDLNTAIEELKADGTLAQISQKYLKTNASGGQDAAAPQPRSALQLVLDNLWPLAKAALTMTIPLTIISFALGLVIALAVALVVMRPVLRGRSARAEQALLDGSGAGTAEILAPALAPPARRAPRRAGAPASARCGRAPAAARPWRGPCRARLR